MFDTGALLRWEEYTDIVLGSDMVDYDLSVIEYNENATAFVFIYDFAASPLANGETDYHNYAAVDDAFNEHWQTFAENIVLTVNGVEYPAIRIGKCKIVLSDEYYPDGTCGATILFPVISEENADIILTAGDESYAIKSFIDYSSGTPWIFSTLNGVVTEDTPADLKDDFYLYVNKDALVETDASG